jgi:hypothetical protein
MDMQKVSCQAQSRSEGDDWRRNHEEREREWVMRERVGRGGEWEERRGMVSSLLYVFTAWAFDGPKIPILGFCSGKHDDVRMRATTMKDISGGRRWHQQHPSLLSWWIRKEKNKNDDW